MKRNSISEYEIKPASLATETGILSPPPPPNSKKNESKKT